MNPKTLRLLLTFYSGFFAATFLITLAATGLYIYLGMAAFTMLFWFKIITSGVIVWYIGNYKRKEFIYYHNLGLSKRFLWTTILSFEMLLFLLFIFIASKLI